jgi:hypothetical protein
MVLVEWGEKPVSAKTGVRFYRFKGLYYCYHCASLIERAIYAAQGDNFRFNPSFGIPHNWDALMYVGEPTEYNCAQCGRLFKGERPSY